MKVVSESVAPAWQEQDSFIPYYEPQRLRAVMRYEILDTPPDSVFDRITSLACRLFRVPMAVISIVDSERVWFKSRQGVGFSHASRAHWPCATAVLRHSPYLVEDAQRDPRLCANPHVTGDFGLRFYAAAPLTTIDGYNIGTLALLDRQPRAMPEAELAGLQELGALVMHELELRVAARRTWELEETLLRKILKEKQCSDFIARHDPVTGLGNRRMLDEAMAIEVDRVRRHGSPLSLALADIDGFGRVNDRFGHSGGDEVLQRFGELLRAQVRPTDIVTRYAADAFAALMPHTALPQAVQSAERIRAAFATQHFAPLVKPLTVTLGVAELLPEESAESLLRRAEQALHLAKRSGRSTVAASDTPLRPQESSFR